MPQIAQQDYKVIAPKEGRYLTSDAAALAELKKSVLNGIAFDCLLKDVNTGNKGTLDRTLGIYGDGSRVTVYDIANGKATTIDLSYTVDQFQGLAAVQNAIDEDYGLLDVLLDLTDRGYLATDDPNYAICVNDKYLTVTGSTKIEALAIAETGPTENFVNITWEDAQKLIGLPLI